MVSTERGGSIVPLTLFSLVQWHKKNTTEDLENSKSLGDHTLYKKMRDDPIDDED